MRIRLDSRGFTIVELLIGLAFFSFLLLFVTFGFVQINRTFTKGITVKTIQETSRSLVEDLTRSIRGSESIDFKRAVAPTDGYQLCLEGVRYGWNQQFGGSSSTPDQTTHELPGNVPYTMIKSFDGGNCGDDFTSYEKILDDRAVVQHLSICNSDETKPCAVGPGTYRIKFVVSTKSADNDLEIYGDEAKCKVQIGDYLCDVAIFETVAMKRN
jgi:hypothetical protein